MHGCQGQAQKRGDQKGRHCMELRNDRAQPQQLGDRRKGRRGYLTEPPGMGNAFLLMTLDREQQDAVLCKNRSHWGLEWWLSG